MRVAASAFPDRVLALAKCLTEDGGCIYSSGKSSRLSSSANKHTIGRQLAVVRACDSGAVQDEESRRQQQQEQFQAQPPQSPQIKWPDSAGVSPRTFPEDRPRAYRERIPGPSLISRRSASRSPASGTDSSSSRGGGGARISGAHSGGEGGGHVGMATLSSPGVRAGRGGGSEGRGSSPTVMETELLLPGRQTSDTARHPLGSIFGSLLARDKLHAPLLPAEPVPGLGRVLTQSAIACLGAYLFGYHLSVVNGSLESVARDLAFAGNSVAKGLVVSLFLVGAFLGCALSSQAADGLGRRRAYLATALPVMLGSSMSALSGSLPVMLAGRFLVGIGLGIGSPLPTLYISEISPPSMRGTLTSLPQVAACIGILLALAAGVYFPATPQGWRWCFWLGAVPAAALVFLSEHMTESPRWLAQKGMWNEAEKAIESLAGQPGTFAGQQALAELKVSAASHADSPEVSWSGLFSKSYRKLIFIGCGLFALQQLSGINSVFYFSSSIFQKAGIQSDVVANVAVGVVNLAAAILSTCLMDRAGRKTLLLGSFAAMGGSLAVQTVCSVLCSTVPSLAWIGPPVALSTTLLYVMAFAMGAGPVPGLLLPEIFPTQIRAKGFALGLSIYWVLNCALGFLFLPLLEAVGSVGLSTFFASMCFAAVLFTQRYIIETKGKSLEEIEAAMSHH